jgi:hypothetical protein
MHASEYRRLVMFQNCFCVLFRLRRGKGSKTFSHFKCLCWQHNAVSRAACCPRTAGWADRIFNAVRLRTASKLRSKYSTVGGMTRIRSGRSKFRSSIPTWYRFLFSEVSRPAPGPNYPHFSEGKAAGKWSWPLTSIRYGRYYTAILPHASIVLY